MPSSSARCSQLPRAVDKLPFYVALRKLRDHLRGDLPNVDDTEVTFPDLELKIEPKKERLDTEVKQEIRDAETNACAGTFPLTVKIKTEDELVSAKQRTGRSRKRRSTAGSIGQAISVPTAGISLSETVVSPYFLPWQQPSVYCPNLATSRSCMDPEAVDMTNPVKQENLFDVRQYGQMPDVKPVAMDLSTVKTYSNMLPLPAVERRF